MKVADAVAVAGHEVHVCRYREARTLLRWLSEDLRGLRVLDVFSAAAPAAPLVAASDRAAHGDGGAIVLVRARRGRQPAASQEGTANR